MKIVAVVNRRGGVGKTVTAHALGAGLRHKGKSVLFIDLDSQTNLSFDIGASLNHPSIADVLTGSATAQSATQHTAGGDIIAASPVLASADMVIDGTGKEYRLREALEPLSALYDYALIDTPPALGVLTVNALTAADEVIIPAQAEVHSLQGVALLNDTILAVKKYCNPQLKIDGILLTRFNGRSIISRDMRKNLEAAAETIGTILIETPIRECVAVKEAQAVQQDIFTYAPTSNAAKDYAAVLTEIFG